MNETDQTYKYFETYPDASDMESSLALAELTRELARNWKKKIIIENIFSLFNSTLFLSW